jgi:small-conductance mechanosensitive channel
VGLLALGGWLSIVAGTHQPASRADSPPPAAAAAPASDELAIKRTKIAEQIAKLTAQRAAAAGKQPSAVVDPGAPDELDLLESLDLVYIQQQAIRDERAALAAEAKKLALEAESLRSLGPAEPKPYSFMLLEDIRDQLGVELDRSESIRTNLVSAQDMLQTARESFEEAERQRRAAHEAAQDNKDAAQQQPLAHGLRLAELKSAIANETVALRRAEIEAVTSRQEFDKMRREYLQAKVALISKDVRFAEQEVQSRFQAMNKNRDECRQRLKLTQKSLHRHEADEQKTLAALREKQASAAVLDAAGEAYQMARRAHCEEIALLNQRLVEMEHFRHLFLCRYELAGGKASPASIAEWRDQIDETIKQRKSLQRSRGARMQEIHVDQSALLRRSHTNQDEQLRPWFEMQTRHLQRLDELYETNLLQLQTGLRSLERFHQDLLAGSPAVSAADRLAAAGRAFGACWNYELASVDDHPVTVGKICGGVFYLFVGMMLARLASGLLGRQILPRLGLNEGASHAVQSILFYALCVLFSLVSLELVNLPFAAFTFLGGAAAIGIGFGSQNIVNNFISGLILLAEQPLRVGDLVDIDGKRGTVERIGARSTRVRTLENHEIVVPNSKLLEDKVTNLTLSDNLVRTAIGVTLTSKLPVPEVRRRLLQSATRHAKVIAEPGPVVLFLGFSKDDLSFELHFWVKLSTLMECRVVESEVREAMNAALANTNAATSAVASPLAPAAALAPAMPKGTAGAAPTGPVGPAPTGRPAERSAAGSIAGKMTADRPKEREPDRPSLRKAS